jgi:hypothetical protein
MSEPDGPYLNVEPAKDFANACSDPVVREVLWTAYGVLVFNMTGTPLEGKFDVLFSFKALVEMLKDRDRLSRVLAGDFSDE